MRLYATGFNAWGQLDFHARGDAGLPDDVASFRCVLQADSILEVRAGLTYTVGKSS